MLYTSADSGESLPTALHYHQQMISTGYDALLAQHQKEWHHFWQGTDILIEGDDEAQRGICYNIYQLCSNASLHDDRYGIAAKGCGYQGHVSHDSEIFMLAVWNYLQTNAPAKSEDLNQYLNITMKHKGKPIPIDLRR